MTSQKPEIIHRIELTGNPFVDTGLAIIAHLSDCSSIDDLTLADMKMNKYKTINKILSQSMSFSLSSLVSSAKILLLKVFLVPLILQALTIRLPRIMKMVAAVVPWTVMRKDS